MRATPGPIGPGRRRRRLIEPRPHDHATAALTFPARRAKSESEQRFVQLAALTAARRPSK